LLDIRLRRIPLIQKADAMQATPRRPVALGAPGPVQLPRIDPNWDRRRHLGQPLLRLETMEGEEVCIPINADSGCVKTCTSQECIELFSLLPSPDRRSPALFVLGLD
jgi:hypothetical protein